MLTCTGTIDIGTGNYEKCADEHIHRIPVMCGYITGIARFCADNPYFQSNFVRRIILRTRKTFQTGTGEVPVRLVILHANLPVHADMSKSYRAGTGTSYWAKVGTGTVSLILLPYRYGRSVITGMPPPQLPTGTVPVPTYTRY